MKCALQGCNRPPWPSVGRSTPHLACGNLHHQLLMASRFNPALPSPYQAILDRNADGLCALPSCKEPPRSAKIQEELPRSSDSWCSCTHYLLWLAQFTSSLQPDQICLVPHCIRHVFVDDNAVPSQFCGWRHRKKFAMLSAFRCRRQEPLPSVEGHPRESPSPASSIQRECDFVASFNSLMHSLKRFALFDIRPKNIRVLEDFYEKHPWEVFTEGHACWLIARLKFSSKGRDLTTKGHYHWKQSGPRAKDCKYTEKLYKYRKRKGMGKEVDYQQAESSYSMKEYTMEDVKLYSLIKLSKGKPFFHGKHHKKQPSKQGSAEINRVCGQDTGTSKLCLSNDHMSMDSIFKGLAPLDSILMGLPPLDDCMLDFLQ